MEINIINYFLFSKIQNEITFIAENGTYIVDQGKELFVAKLEDEDVQKVVSAINKYPSQDKRSM